MKKILTITILLILIFGSFLIIANTTSWFWQTVEIEKIGTIKVPNDWVVTEKDGFLYFTDKPLEKDNCITYLVQTYTYFNNSGDPFSISNENIETIYYIEFLSSQVFSNSAVYGEGIYETNGIRSNYYFIEVYNGNTWFNFLTPKDTVKEITIRNIAKSFRMYTSDELD